MAASTVAVRQAVSQAIQPRQDSSAPPPDAADQFQSLFDDGAFEPSTNEKPVQRYHPDSDQYDPELDGEQAQAGADGETGESDKGAQSASAESNSEEGENEGEQGPQYASIDEFLTAHKIDPESFRGLNVALKVNGETRMAPLAELIKNYQLESAITQKSQAFAQEQQAWQTERTAMQTLYKQQIQQAHGLGQLAYNQLMAEYQQVPWQQLRQSDLAQYNALRTDFQDRHNAIQNHMNQVAQAQTAEEQRSKEELTARLPKERERMMELRPEWRDPQKFTAARTAIKEFGRKMGFTDAELGSVYDHRHMLILDMAASYAALQASAPGALKKVRAAPPMAKPGARQGRDPKTVARTQAQERFLKNPRDTDAQAAYFETLLS